MSLVEPLFAMTWGAPGQAMVPAYDDLALMYVPASEIWIVEAAGVFVDGTPSSPCDFKLQYQVKDVEGGTGGWLVPLHVNVGRMDTTPVLALERRVVLSPHTRLSARVAWSDTTTKMGLMLTGFKLPYSPENLDRAVLGTSAAPHLSAFVAACQTAAQALAAIQQP